MVNDVLYLYLSFLILIIVVITTTIYPSLTLALRYLFNILTPFFSPSLRKSLFFSHSHLIYLPSTLPLISFSLLFRHHLFLFFLLYRRFLDFFCTAISTRISGLAGLSFW